MVWITRHRIYQDKDRTASFSASLSSHLGPTSCEGSSSQTKGKWLFERRKSVNEKHSLFNLRNPARKRRNSFKEEETTSTVAEDELVIVQSVPEEAIKDVQKKNGKQIRFDTVQIRTYSLVLGDNPHLCFPLSLGWEYNEQETTTLESYDTTHHENNPDYISAQNQSPLLQEERRARLLQQGYPDKELRQQECRRQIQVAMEWAYRYDHPDKDIPCTLPNAARVIDRFII